MKARSKVAASELTTKERWRKRGLKVAIGLGGSAVGLATALGIDSAVTMALEPDIAPGIARISSQEMCEKATAVYAVVPGTGLGVAKHTGRLVRETAEHHDACVLAGDYGTHYNSNTQSMLTDELRQGIKTITPTGSQPKKVIIHSLSFGIFPARDIFMSEDFREAEEAGELEMAALIAESAPSGKESVKGFWDK